jgi:hypothetical protein
MMNSKGCGKKQPWPVVRYLSNQPGGTEVNHRTPQRV